MSIRFYSSPIKVLRECVNFGNRWLRTTGWKVAAGLTAAAVVAPDTTYWFAAGVLSSIGLGAGFHTGPLLLFPFISETTTQQVSLLDTASVCAVPVLSWGLGTALGELPPYYAGPHLAKSLPSIQSLVKKAEGTILRHGSLAIFLMACYPNVTFDAAGMAAGAMGMPQGKFLSAVICGKALVKAPLQALFVYYSTQGLIAVGMDDTEYMGTLKAVWGTASVILLGSAFVLTAEQIANTEICRRKQNQDGLGLE